METPDSQQSYSNAVDYLHLRRPLPTGYPLHKRYRITGVLSEGGGFGMTYRAVDTYRNLNLDVVVKENFPLGVAVRNPDTMELLPLPGMVDFYAKTLQRFAEEAELLSSLNHPNIVRVSAHFSELNTAYYVMPYIGGTELHRALPGSDKLNEATLLPVLRCLLKTLHYMHGHNLMHRDIKPNNILMDADGTLKLIDFGLVRSTEATHTLTRHYTPGYAPVEQISGKGKSGPWTDIYSLGATCYALITGTPPPDSVERLIDDEYEPLQSLRYLHGRYSSTLLAGIDRALQVKPTERWQSAGEWLADLTADNTNDTTPGGVPSEPPRRSRSNVALILLILLLALGIPGGYVLYQHAQEIGAQRLLAQQEAEQKAQEEAERKAREEAERKAKEEAERKAREEAERKAREEAERKAREEAERMAREEAERKAREEAERKDKEEAERKAREEAERMAREEAERKAREEAERKAREEAERKVREEAERKAKEEAERKAREEAKRLLSRKGISESEYSRRIISAAEKGNNELLSLLITAGADVNAADKDGWTPLHSAACDGHSECVKLLLAAPGIDVNKTYKYGETPLYTAAYNGHSECVKLLLAAPDIDVNKANKNGRTPLNSAAIDGHSECVKLLLAAPGIDVNLADKIGSTPLRWAACMGHRECVKLLLAAPGIDVNKEATLIGSTPLLSAACNGQTECVKLLLAAPGIDVNKEDKYGGTPLSSAAALGRTECVKLLLAAPGINVNKEDEDGDTPLEAAEANGKTECARLIRAAGGHE